ncbi:MAG: hypothetical protein ACI81P_000206 [Neolewinella sp.]|jgi:hypothetical protein
MFLPLILGALTTLAAQDLTTPLLSDTWQATFSNPALYGQAKGRFTVGLPGVSNDLYTENVTYNQLLVNENGQRILDLDRLVDLLGERNELRNDFTLETIGVGLRGDRLSFGLYHRLRAFGQVDYPKALVQLAVQGNAQFVGQTVEVAPLGYATSYHELGLGGSYAITDKIHFGARIKYLSGIADVRTSTQGSLQLTTDEDNFALTLDQDLTINTAGTIDYNGFDDISINYDLNRIQTDDLFSSNNGIAFDLGLFADLGNIRLQAAANDLGGKVEWTNEVSNFTLSGVTSFSGLDILAQVLEDSLSFNTALDSLQVTFEPTESNTPYTTKLGGVFLIGGEYDVTDRITAGLLLVRYNREVNPETAFAITARYKVLDQLTVGFNYNARREAAANFGGHLVAHLGPVNLLASTDNLLTVFSQKDNSRASVRLGASISIGGEKRVKGEKE